jgi:hypothetical protein
MTHERLNFGAGGPAAINVATTQLNAGTKSSLDSTVFMLVGGYSMVQDVPPRWI